MNKRTYTGKAKTRHAKRMVIFIAAMIGFIVFSYAAGCFSSSRQSIIAAAAAADVKIKTPYGAGGGGQQACNVAAPLTIAAIADEISREPRVESRDEIENRKSKIENAQPLLSSAGSDSSRETAAPTHGAAVSIYKVTAYCPCAKCCGRFADGITASGHRIRKGDRFCAADKSIPFGTMIIIPGYNDGKPVPVLDRGGAITAGRLDVYFDEHDEARAWGIKNLSAVAD